MVLLSNNSAVRHQLSMGDQILGVVGNIKISKTKFPVLEELKVSEENQR